MKEQRKKAAQARSMDWTELHRRIQEVQSVAEHGTGVALSKYADHDHRSFGSMVDNFLEDMKKVLMLPFSSLLEILPKQVRDLSRDLGKDVELVMHGSEIEIDRRILEEMKDPLIHIVRNCIDHGLEKPQVRAQRGKPARGKLTIGVSQTDGNSVEILITDDGGGIDVAKVKSAAVRHRIVSQEDVDKMSDAEAMSLIFQSELSTSPIITDLSGRGLGLAIVREKVEKLGGLASVQATPGTGTTFRLLLPLTLATFRGILVQSAGQLFVVPTANVERVTRVAREAITSVENRATVTLNGRSVSMVSLQRVLELPEDEVEAADKDYVQLLVVGSGDKRIAFGIDEVLHEQEVLVKSLGKNLERVRNIAAATVLGTGRVVPILSVPDLLKSATRVGAEAGRASSGAKADETKRHSILIAEDSITSRMLLKNILESASYDVKATVDGMDAFTTLKNEDFDLVVSDVEMPRMSGFELVAKMRADKKLASIPVVLVTSLESREHRERGIEVGANAYIVKSSFDQSNLLDVVQKLI